MELNTKYGIVKIFTDNIEEQALSQVIQMSNSILGKNAHIRIMPDVHAGAGCVIGTTMKITDKVCPNLVGVDIGCGVTIVKTDIDFSKRFEELDNIIRENIPYGMTAHTKVKKYDFSMLKCWDKLDKETKELSQLSLGSLGGGNHFIEAYSNGYLSVHSGSRNIGWKVADYYQRLAKKQCSEIAHQELMRKMQEIELKERSKWLQENKIIISEDLAYLQGQEMQDYLYDIGIMQKFADDNRHIMLSTIVSEMDGNILNEINSVHNYIDIDGMILRKGSICADKGKILVIPLNMRDGVLICKGKGNEDWNNSAPHGAGRLYSRTKAKQAIKLQDYKESMKGIFSTCINESTIDESPFAYKDYQEIIRNVESTVEIMERLKPIYNFKAN